MTTIRESIEAEVASLEAKLAEGTARLHNAIAVEKAKLDNLHPTLLAVLEHPIDEVRAFFRTFGAHLFDKAAAPAPAAAPSAPSADSTSTSETAGA